MMKTTMEPVTELAASAARASLPESVTVGAATLLPRGADPFVGTERPLLFGATRWTYVAPGGILIGGSPTAMAAVLGFDLPARPGTADPEERREGDDAPARWSDLVTEAARPAITNFTQAVATPIAGLVQLPPDCSPTQVSFNDSDAQVRSEAGLTPDAVVLLLHAEEHEVRLCIVVPGVFAARLRRSPGEAETAPAADAPGADAGEGVVLPLPVAPLRLTTGPLGTALAKVPLDLSLELGQARVPLAQVLHLREGEVIELRQAIDAPVDLVSESTAVARGDLEVSDAGNLVLLVTSIPGRPDAPASPVVMDDQPEGAGVGEAGEAPPAAPPMPPPGESSEASAAPDPLAPASAIPNPDAPLSDPAPPGEAPDADGPAAGHGDPTTGDLP